VAPPAAQGAAPTATPTATPAPTPPGPRPSPVGPRIALFPLTNRSGGAAATKAVTALLREKLLRRGIQLAAEEDVMKVLAEKRVRYTGGIDIEIADALRQEVGVEGVLIVDLEVYLPGPPCKFGLTARLVSTLGEPVIHWADGIARSGVDRPGLLGLGVIPNIEKLREVVLDQVADSLVASFTNARRVVPCPDWSGRDPDRMFRSAIADDPDRRSIAVLPFVNDTGRRDAGEVTALRLLAPLVNSGLLEVVEPGVVRREMLSYRLGAGGGISLDDARVILELLNSDLVLSGTVRTFEDAAGSSGAPRVDFSVWVLDRKTGELVWSSTASAEGDDGVFFFGLGKVTTASALACTVAKQTVGRILEDRKPRPHPIGEPAPPAPVPDAGKSQDAAPVPSQAPEAPGPAAPETNPAPAGPAPETPAASTRPTGDAGFAQPPAGGARSASP
jgi:TolB-like protein